jgi:transposase InsO family protein
VIAADGLPVQLACRVLNVSESGYYARRLRAPSARAIRHAWLTDMIREVHVASRGTYGIRRVHADLILGQGIAVGHLAVEMLMRRAGIQGVSGRPRYRHVPGVATAGDRVERQFHRDQPNQLWVTDITEHPTREGKVYCAVVLDAWSRRVVGWSIDSRPSTALVTNALGMAIESAGHRATPSSTATRGRNSPRGRSRVGPSTPGCSRQWVPSVIATTTR